MTKRRVEKLGYLGLFALFVVGSVLGLAWQLGCGGEFAVVFGVVSAAATGLALGGFLVVWMFSVLDRIDEWYRHLPKG
jgi:hypothetical protein